MLEALESRIAPAGLSVTAYHGILTIKGIPAGAMTIDELALLSICRSSSW